MMNKIIVVVIVILALVGAGYGYYSYTLNQQVISISGQLTSLQAEHNERLAAINEELAANLPRIDQLEEETSVVRKSVANLEEELNETKAGIGIVENEIDETRLRVTAVEGEIGETLAVIDTLENEITTVTTELSQSQLNAHKVYEQVFRATVRVTDGVSVIGSGFIFDNESHIMTAYHVIDNLSEIYIVFPDGKTSKATVTGSSRDSDVAVLTLVDKPAIEAPVMADSSALRIGEPVIAIGNPFDLSETLTAGVVSQINRTAEIEYDSQTRRVNNLIQFDAAINFGNSGGALVNSRGEIVGMVIARVNPNTGDGIYYAVSSNKFKKVAASLIENGVFEYPWLGIAMVDITPRFAQDNTLETINGVVIKGISAGGPAAVSGIRVDDILLTIDGMIIRDADGLTSYLGEYKTPGDLATITLIRGTDNLELSLEIGKRQS